MKKGFRKGLVFFAAFVYLFFGVLELDAFARAGGGRSSGSRGSRPSGPSRSYSPPSQPKSDPGSYGAQTRPTNPQPGWTRFSSLLQEDFCEDWPEGLWAASWEPCSSGV